MHQIQTNMEETREISAHPNHMTPGGAAHTHRHGEWSHLIITARNCPKWLITESNKVPDKAQLLGDTQASAKTQGHKSLKYPLPHYNISVCMSAESD
uniref:Prolactin receptor n=1 Tax=Engystomops pustulosus TaxID=76066 RepID=A0AAV6YL04_ENGPU|nr:hypothetical protein GDO81_018865 [Engystomops pustulosus]